MSNRPEPSRPSVGRRRPGRRPLGASVALHVVLLAFAWVALSSAPAPIEMVVYRVDLVSPPPQVLGEPELVMEAPQVVTPEPPPPEPEPEPEPAPRDPEPEQTEPEPEPERETAPAPPQAQEAERPEPREERPVAGDRPDPRSTGGEDLDVRIEGEEFPFPGYLENITRQIRRHFRWTGDDRLSATVFFYINRDGSVSDLRVTRPSGNVQFDFEGMAAVEQAGRRGAFGALPDGFQGDRLPVSFSFEPVR